MDMPTICREMEAQLLTRKWWPVVLTCVFFCFFLLFTDVKQREKRVFIFDALLLKWSFWKSGLPCK